MFRAGTKAALVLGLAVSSVLTTTAGHAAVEDPDIDTFATYPDEVAAQMLGMIPLGRAGTLDEVAQVAAFLLSDAASFLTGINIEIAGGSS